MSTQKRKLSICGSLAIHRCTNMEGLNKSETLAKISSIPCIDGFFHFACWDIIFIMINQFK